MKSPKWGLQMIAKLVKITPVLGKWSWILLHFIGFINRQVSLGGPPVVFVGLSPQVNIEYYRYIYLKASESLVKILKNQRR